MNYDKNFYLNNIDNDDINIYLNKNIELDILDKSLKRKNKSNIGTSSIMNYSNNSSNLNKSQMDNFNNSHNFSSSLKDQILSPGDDDISLNFEKNKISLSRPINYLDDDIIYHFNYHLKKNNDNLYLSRENEKDHYSKLNINSNLKKKGKKTLILDLDETLVHSSFKPICYDNICYKPDIFLNINFRGNSHSVYVLKRPFVHEFLKEMNKIYNIVIFTASIKEYANPLLDKLDTEKIIKKRLFREDCSLGINRKFIKDLKILNMNLKDLILVDNNPISYSYNICNGVPIKSWHYDKTDQELIKMIPFLQFLANVNDVRDYIPKFVENDSINFNKINFMINEINNENEQNKYLRPRAKSQKKLLGYTKRHNSFNGFNNKIYPYFEVNNEEKQINEDIKEDLEIKKKKYMNNYIDLIPNKRNNNNLRLVDNLTNFKDNYNYNYENNNINDKNIRNNYHNDKSNPNYKNNNNIITNNFMYNNTNIINEQNENKKYNEIFKEEKNKLKKSYSKDKIEFIQNYYKNGSFKSDINNYNNNHLNNGEFRNYHRNKSKNYSNIRKEKIDMNNLYINNYIDNNEIRNNKKNNIYKNRDNLQNQNRNEKINKYINNENNENNKRNNNLFNYQPKMNDGYITPQINNKYISNYSIFPYTSKNKSINSNINNIFSNSCLNYNQSNNNKNIDNKKPIDTNLIINLQQNKDYYYLDNGNSNNNNSNYIQFYKELQKNYYNYKYNCLKRAENKIETNGHINEKNNIHRNTSNNFYLLRENNNKIYNINHSNSNSIPNLNIYQNNLYRKEDNKINNIMNQENDLNLNNIHNSSYKISKETNYYIKRRMKLNTEKITDNRKENGNKNEYYNYFNNIKNVKEHNLNNEDNYFYNEEQKIF